jgi:hypothetical protein
MENVEPVYERLPGWKTSTFGVSNYDDLPARAKDYLAFLESPRRRRGRVSLHRARTHANHRARRFAPGSPAPLAVRSRDRQGVVVLDWREGGTSWTQDYPRADRHFAQALRRLTRVHVRSVEQPVNPDDGDDAFNWPWMNAGEMGDWKLTDRAGRTLREYLLRGGFLMLDDFWGAEEFARFDESMKARLSRSPRRRNDQ